MTISYEQLLEGIAFKNQVQIRIENRWDMEDYGFPRSHGEIMNFSKNKADMEKWDVLFLGYSNPNFKYNDVIMARASSHIGTILITDGNSTYGNHKLLFKQPYKRGFTHTKLSTDLRNFTKRYKRKWPSLKLRTIMFI